ncbi:MAG: hypothetical protein FWC73_06445 [Defluviitaleaceae bacterium]|nr:hypothetical protein [Defluviitaleaceae bacterium]
MNNDVFTVEQEENEKSDLLQLYNIIDWIDFGLVFAIIFYVGNAFRDTAFTYAFRDTDFVFYSIGDLVQSSGVNIFDLPPSMLGLLLCVASLVVSISAIIVSRLIHKTGAHRSRVRLIGRYIMWGIWIPIDIYFLVVYAVGLIG